MNRHVLDSSYRLVGVALLTFFYFTTPAIAGDAATPGDLIVDPATFRCLAFRWPLEGDDNANARVEVRFRQVGRTEWRPAQPLLRVHHEVVDRAGKQFTCGNLFAGSIMQLEPATGYEVQFDLTDPDGGNRSVQQTSSTRAFPKEAADGRQLHVYPPTHKGPRQQPAYDLPRRAARAARPGDIILLHAGVHHGEQQLSAVGTPQRPIVFRPAGDGPVIFDGDGIAGNIFDIQGGKHHLHFEGLTIRNGRTAIKANGSDGLVVRRCRIENIESGIITYKPTRNWLLEDNTILGRDETWFPRKMRRSHTGIIILGSGHVVQRNRIRNFWDCLAIGNYGPPRSAETPVNYSIDMFSNDLSHASDDGLETDFGSHNIRVRGNRIVNCHTGISAQPLYGGPCYVLRNELYNIASLGLKLHNYCTGLEIHHNTIVTSERGFNSFEQWQNTRLRNNLFLGVNGYALETGSPHPATSLDYNGYRKTSDPLRFIKWYDGDSWRRYATLADFHQGAGHEQHGIRISTKDFVRLEMPAPAHSYTPADFDLRLTEGSAAVDAAVTLSNITGPISGKAADLGCREQGQPAPHYGPRKP